MKKVKPASLTTKVLVATQVAAITATDGSTGLVMLDKEGVLYTYVGTGWVRLNMMEVDHDTQV